MTPDKQAGPSVWKMRWARAKATFHQFRKATGRQVHDDEAVRRAWAAIKDDIAAQERTFRRLREMLARSTASINNSYLKVQISSGIVVGLIALFLGVFAQRPRVNWPLLIIGTVMEATSIAVSLLIPTPHADTAFLQEVKTPGVLAIQQTPEEECVSLSRHAFHNRVVLLDNRRLAWIAMWLLTLPGLAVAFMAWAWFSTLIALAIISPAVWSYKRYISGRGPGSLQYPSP